MLIDNTNTMVGLVSFGFLCGAEAGVYARVSGVMDWIDQQICDLSPPRDRPSAYGGTQQPVSPNQGLQAIFSNVAGIIITIDNTESGPIF